MIPAELNASFYPELTDVLKNIINDISIYVIKEGHPIIILEGGIWYKEVISLMAKQINLCDSCILLLENGMEQEAYLIARSQFNNMLWIKYICEGAGDSRIKEYFYQPHINQILTNKNLKKMLEEFGDTLDSQFDINTMLDSLNQSIDENENILRQENIDIKPKSIAKLSKQDSMLFGMYITFYNDGSKFEHSDISKTRKYRKQIIDGYTEDQVFTIDMATSNKEEWLTVFRYSFLSIYLSFESVYNRIDEHEKHMFLDTPVSNATYSKKDFFRIWLELNTCWTMLEDVEHANADNANLN